MSKTVDQQIEEFLKQGTFAVAGASSDRSKYGNKVLRVYLQNRMTAFPINPKAAEVEGLTAYPSLGDIPNPVGALSIITPPAITRKIVQQAIEMGIKHIWMQPGAEDDEAIETAQKAGLNVIHGGPCVLVSLRFHDD